jgi:hypothetical protein
VTGIDFRGFEVSDDVTIWRYMTIDRFRQLLDGSLYFASANQFDDKFEGAITDAEVARRSYRHSSSGTESNTDLEWYLASVSSAFEELRRLTKISCWHAREHENIAMWERYLPSQEAGVAIRSSVGRLKRSLREFRLAPQYGEEKIYIGQI